MFAQLTPYSTRPVCRPAHLPVTPAWRYCLKHSQVCPFLPVLYINVVLGNLIDAANFLRSIRPMTGTLPFTLTKSVKKLTRVLQEKKLEYFASNSFLRSVICARHWLTFYLRQRRYMFLPVSVCLSVSKITQKLVHGFGWNVACRQMSGYGRTD